MVVPGFVGAEIENPGHIDVESWSHIHLGSSYIDRSIMRGFVSANANSQNFPLVVKRGGTLGYGLFCGPRSTRAGEEILRVPPALWLPYCSEAAVRKAEVGAPDFLARLSNACGSIGGDASRLAPVACLALELLFTLERQENEPYLSLLWQASRGSDTSSLPHPLLMGPVHLDHLQASPLRDSIDAARKIYGSLHRNLFGIGDGDLAPPAHDDHASKPSAASTRDFLWALGVILSRGISEDGAGGTGLVPYLDFANHGGGEGEVSCERGFDEATGNHFLRALRDVEPGEEFLIDYGSDGKGIYRFARTYGFISCGRKSADGAKRHTEPKDTLRVDVVGASQPPTVVAPPQCLAGKGGTHHQPAGAGVTQRSGNNSLGGRARGGTRSHTEQLLRLDLPVSFEAVAGDPLLMKSGDIRSAVLNVADPLAVFEALKARLRRYPTSLEQDLAVLGLVDNFGNPVEGAGEVCRGVVDGAGGTTVDPTGKGHGEAEEEGGVSEWVEMCVRVRAAEKIALRRALQETRNQI